MDHFTDDSVLTFALAEWALEYGKVPLGDCDTVAAMAGGGLLLHTKTFGEYNAVINERGG